MSGFDPGMIRAVVGYDTGLQEFVGFLMCSACDPCEPESITVWSGNPGPTLAELDITARAHWRKWHTDEH
jgi:hypothetical protein